MSALDVAIDLATGNQIPGDYLEFGVYRGDSFIRAYHRFKSNQRSFGLPSMRFVALDSFAGLPESRQEGKPKQYTKGAYAASEKAFRKNLRRGRVEEGEVIVLNKWYDLLEERDKRDHGLTQAAVVYFDCDLYESTKSALDFVAGLVQDGTIFVFDDFWRHRASPDAGIRRAWGEFLQGHPGITATLVHNFRRVAFALHVGGQSPDS